MNLLPHYWTLVTHTSLVHSYTDHEQHMQENINYRTMPNYSKYNIFLN